MRLLSVNVADSPKPNPVTLSQFTSWAKLPSAALDSANAQIALDAAVWEVERIANRLLSARQVVEVWQGVGQIRLSYEPNAPASIVAMAGPGPSGPEPDPPAIVEIEAPAGIVELPSEGYWQITYTSGGDVAQLHGAILQLALTFYNDRENNVMAGMGQVPTNVRKRVLQFRRY